jgi:O-antigen ligase
VLLVILSPGGEIVLLLTLAVALYLTVIELRELRPHWKWWAWWLSLVFLTHFVGYLALRGYAAYRHRQRARA